MGGVPAPIGEELVPVREIIPHTLWIGNALEARDARCVMSAGIRAIVDVAMEEPPIPLPRDMIYCRFPLVDGAGNSRECVRAAIGTTVRFVTLQVPTLVTCSAGMSRSPAIVAAALTIIEGVSLEEALRRVTDHQPHDVSASFLMDVAEACRALEMPPV